MTLKLIYPALAQVFWTFVVLVIVFLRRKKAFDNREVGVADVAVSTERYPEPARLAAAEIEHAEGGLPAQAGITHCCGM